MLRCVYCGGSPNSKDSKCHVVIDYRVAVTRNLLKKSIPKNIGYNNFQLSLADFLQLGTAIGRALYSTITQTMRLNLNDVLS